MNKVSDWFKSLGRSIGEATNLHFGESWKDYTSRIKSAWKGSEGYSDPAEQMQTEAENYGTDLGNISDPINKLYDTAQKAVEDFTGVSAQKEVQDSINQTNRELTEATNKANLKMNNETNAFNRDIAYDTNQANRQIAEATNATNQNIASQNIAYQRELQEYQKALQERVFEREDTAYQRTAQDMIKAGLNPLSMQGTNGAGEIISMSPLHNEAQAVTGAPMQAYENKATHFDSPYYQNQIQMKSIADFLASTTGLIQGIQQLKTGSIQRDGIALENDKKRIDNFITMAKNGIAKKDGKLGARFWNYDSMEDDTTQKMNQFDIKIMKDRVEGLRAMREYEHMIKNDMYETDNKYEQMLTAFEDWIINGRGEQAFEKLIEKYPILGTFYNKNKKEAQ